MMQIIIESQDQFVPISGIFTIRYYQCLSRKKYSFTDEMSLLDCETTDVFKGNVVFAHQFVGNQSVIEYIYLLPRSFIVIFE